MRGFTMSARIFDVYRICHSRELEHVLEDGKLTFVEDAAPIEVLDFTTRGITQEEFLQYAEPCDDKFTDVDSVYSWQRSLLWEETYLRLYGVEVMPGCLNLHFGCPAAESPTGQTVCFGVNFGRIFRDIGRAFSAQFVFRAPSQDGEGLITEVAISGSRRYRDRTMCFNLIITEHRQGGPRVIRSMDLSRGDLAQIFHDACFWTAEIIEAT